MYKPSYHEKDSSASDTKAPSVGFKFAEKQGAGLRKTAAAKRTNKNKVKAQRFKRASHKK